MARLLLNKPLPGVQVTAAAGAAPATVHPARFNPNASEAGVNPCALISAAAASGKLLLGPSPAAVVGTINVLGFPTLYRCPSYPT